VTSVFRPAGAAPEAIGMPYIVFIGNVFAGNAGGEQALARVAAIPNGRQRDR
jgi:hypothetical protein